MTHEELPEPTSEERIRSLTESGEAFDRLDAEDIVREEDDAAMYRELVPAEVLLELRELVQNPETHPLDRWGLQPRLAVVETAAEMDATPDERVFLIHNTHLDLEVGEGGGPAAAERRAHTKTRLQKKIDTLGAIIGEERAETLFRRYREHLQRIVDEAPGT